MQTIIYYILLALYCPDNIFFHILGMAKCDRFQRYDLGRSPRNFVEYSLMSL